MLIDTLADALMALGSMPDGFCFCGENRNPLKPDEEHTGECHDARAALEQYLQRPTDVCACCDSEATHFSQVDGVHFCEEHRRS